MVGNSISRVCPYIKEWDLDGIFRNIKQGEIITKEIQNDETKVKIAIEFCKSSGGKSMTIGNASAMVDKGSWQTFPQPHLPKSKNEYKVLFRFGFQYKGFKFMCDYMIDKSSRDTIFFIYPYFKDFDLKTIVFSDIVKPTKYWQRDIYNISIKNDKLKRMFQTFKENKIFFSDDMCGTDFKQCIDFLLRK